MRHFLSTTFLFLTIATVTYIKPALASYTCDRACELCEIGKTVDCASYDYAKCMEPVNALQGGIDQPDSPFYKGWAACQRMGSYCGASDRDSVCDVCNNRCKPEAAPAEAPSAEATDYETEKKNGCLRGAANGDAWDEGIRMCHCGYGRTLNAEHTRCVASEPESKAECLVAEDCAKQSAPTYECRGKELYAVSPYQCIQSKCVMASPGNTKLLHTCEEKCVDGYCYAKVNSNDLSNLPWSKSCQQTHDCPVIVDGRGCADKHTVLYAFLVPFCIDRMCVYNKQGETIQTVPCLGDERCISLSGKSQCVISDVK